MENTMVSGNRRTFRAALFGVVMLVFGGTALAATAPAVAPLKFEYTDAKGNKIENKITSGYEANVVAVDASGNVYVSDAVSNTVSVFNTNGRLIKQLNVNRATAVGVDKDGFKYINGSLNGGIGIFVFDGNDNGAGNLGTNWGQPGAINIFDAKSRDSSKGDKDYDVYVSDTVLNIVRRLTLDADKSMIETKDYGPYIGERYAGEKWTYSTSKPGYQGCATAATIYVTNTYTYDRTRHRILLVPTVGVDAANGLMYVAAREVTEYLTQTPASFYVSECTVKGETGCSGNDSNYMLDTEESWRNYNGSMAYVTTTFCDGKLKSTSQTVQAITTDSSYVYWNPVDPSKPPAAYKSYILVIDMNTGAILRKISSGLGDGSSGFHPRGLTLDGNGRLYAAGTDVTSPSVGITVYDVTVNPETVLLSSSNDANNKFSPGNYMTIAYSPDTADSAKGRLFAAVADGRSVFSYGIDGGTNPLNTAPGKPILLEPVNSAAVNTPTPTLKIKNASDPQNDPLTYGYEIKDSDGNVVASAAGIPGGSNNETIMTVTQGLADSSYHWRTQSFDGELAEWSDEATFCVDYVNTNPTDPAAIAPVNNAPVSPFASSLSWTASNDYDCANDAVTYEVTVYDNLGNVLKSFSGVDSTSIKVSDISGLVRGNTYKWTVRAVDSRGGKSGYGEGSFVYKTSVVKFESSQPGTKVYIDGNYGYLGRSLGAASVEVQDITPGSHFVAFIKAGYEPLYKLADVVDPLVNDSAVTVSAKDVEWVTASRIKPSGTGVEIVRLNGGDSVPFVVDYNNDGLKDMIAGDKEGKIYLYLAQEQLQQDGTKKVVLVDSGAIQADGSDINAGSKAVPFIVDYNNDGRKDLLVGSGDGLIYLYENGGTDTLPVFASAGNIKDSSGGDIKVTNSAPVVVDYNNDGRKDLVVGGAGGALRRYENIGTDASPAFDTPVTIKADNSDLSAGINSNSKVFFTDWNSDGKKDMVVGGNALNLFFNVGTDDAPVFVSIQGLQQWIKDKKRERGNREFIPYLGYNHDLDDLTGGSGEASPFVVDWSGTSARDVIVGNGSGGVVNYITE